MNPSPPALRTEAGPVLRISCPCCGVEGDETEFAYGGEAHIARPEGESASDAEWAEYLGMRTNPMGPHLERWRHAFGCGKWFHLARDTVTQQVFGAYAADCVAPPEEIRQRMAKEPGS